MGMIGCNHNAETTYEQGPVISLIDSMTIPESSFLAHSGILDIAIDDSAQFYMTDMGSRRIIQTKWPFTEHTVLGRPGQGPGEYSMPMFLDVEQEYLFYSSLGSGLVKSMHIENNTTTKTQDIAVSAAASQVQVYRDTLAIYNGSIIPPLQIYNISTRTPQLIGKGQRIDPRYEFPAGKVTGGGGIDISNSGTIYTVPVSRFQIQQYNLRGELQSVIDVQNPANYTPFSNDLYKQAQSDEMEKWQEAVVSFSHIYRLWLVESRDGTEHIVTRSQLPDTESHVYHYIDPATGEVLKTQVSNMQLKAVNGANLYFFEWVTLQQKSRLVIRVYEYNL
jgi:hypothetical protein